MKSHEEVEQLFAVVSTACMKKLNTEENLAVLELMTASIEIHHRFGLFRGFLLGNAAGLLLGLVIHGVIALVK